MSSKDSMEDHRQKVWPSPMRKLRHTQGTQMSGALCSPREGPLSPAGVSFETYKATNLGSMLTPQLPSARKGRVTGSTLTLLGGFLGLLARVHIHPHGLCFPCPGGHLCWEHQEAQTAGRSLGSMSWLVSHGCISLQVSKMQIKSLLGFWEMTNSERISECQHRGGQPAGELGLLHKLLRKILCFSSVKSRGFSETQERGRAITAHSVAHGSAKSHSVESTQNG